MASGQRDRLVEQRLGRHDAVEEPDPLGLLGEHRRPVNAISAARPGPTSRGSVYDVPSSPTDSPIFTNAALIFAFGDASRMSARERQRHPAAGGGAVDAPRSPAPAARGSPPSRSWPAPGTSGTRAHRAPVSRSISSRSKPAQNALSPAPVMISARSSSSSRSSSGSAARSSNIWNDCEFIRSGRLSVATTIPGSGCGELDRREVHGWRCRARWAPQAAGVRYRSSTSSAYLALTSARLSLPVSVSSSVPGVHAPS